MDGDVIHLQLVDTSSNSTFIWQMCLCKSDNLEIDFNYHMAICMNLNYFTLFQMTEQCKQTKLLHLCIFNNVIIINIVCLYIMQISLEMVKMFF
jgi:hypothetical protein